MIIVEIAGNLGADPEERFTGSGKRVVSLRVAARAGKDKTVWWRVNIWSDRFDRMLPYLKKGSSVIVIGDMAEPETYVDKNGQTQVSLTLNAEMVKFSPFGRTDREGSSAPRQQQPQQQQAASDPFAAPTQPEMATYGAGTQETQSPFAGDDLPF